MSAALDHAARDRFMTLELPSNVYQAEYIWIGGSGKDLRSKTRTLSTDVPQKPENLPIWNFDGSSTGQAPGNDSEVLLKPQRIFRDPFRRGNNIMVICDCYKPDMTPLPGNSRYVAERIFAQKAELHPWFGIEQEYLMLDNEKNWPVGWPRNGYPGEQGPYYCSAGAENAFGRDLAEAHYRACLFAGIKISGTNAEVLPGQWEFQVGPCEGLEMGDSLIAARYIMARLGEDFNIRVSYDPKPIPGDWNGSGAHCNYSTEETRAAGGIAAILKYCERLGKRHAEHIQAYGEGNERRLSGKHETAPIDRFSYGVANRGASIRIPREAERNGCGYMEDRRPAANSDPYLVTALIFETTCLLNL